MDGQNILGELFDKKILSVIRFFLLNKEKTFYLKEISSNIDVPIATVFRIIKKLKEFQIIEEIQIKHLKLYRCANNEKIHFLEGFVTESKKGLDYFVSVIAKVTNVEEIILYGKESIDKANLIIIGKSIDFNEVKKICGECKDKYGYIITPLILEKEQYEQMSSMGLYSEIKKSLFAR